MIYQFHFYIAWEDHIWCQKELKIIHCRVSRSSSRQSQHKPTQHYKKANTSHSGVF